MTLELEKNLQRRLTSHFDQFKTINRGGWKFSSMPTRQNIPRIHDVNYNNDTDVFELSFDVQARVDNDGCGNVRFLESPEGQVVGFRVLNARRTRLDELRRELLQDIRKELKKDRSVDDIMVVMRHDQERRKLSFLAEVIGMLPKILKAVQDEGGNRLNPPFNKSTTTDEPTDSGFI